MLSFLDPVWALLARFPLPAAALLASLSAAAFPTGHGDLGTILICSAATLMIWRSEQDQPADAIEESFSAAD